MTLYIVEYTWSIGSHSLEEKTSRFETANEEAAVRRFLSAEAFSNDDEPDDQSGISWFEDPHTEDGSRASIDQAVAHFMAGNVIRWWRGDDCCTFQLEPGGVKVAEVPAVDVCPYCSAEGQMSWGSFECEGFEAWQDVDCGACDKAWHEVYQFERRAPFEEPA